jgi:hypothetical protein
MRIFVTRGVSDAAIEYLQSDGHRLTMPGLVCSDEPSLRVVLADDLARICDQCDGVAVVQEDDDAHPALSLGRALGLVILVFPKTFSFWPHTGVARAPI